MACAKNFQWGGSFNGIWWSFVFGVRCLWCHNLTSYSCFQNNVLAKFVDIICIFIYRHSPYFMGHCTEYKLTALQVRISEENVLNATTERFITAKISGCASKQGSKSHSSLRQSNLQLQNEAALMSCPTRAVKHRKRATPRGQAKILTGKFLTSRHVCMQRVIFYISNTLWKLMIRV